MKKKILITGISGFSGSNLLDFISSKKIETLELHGLSRHYLSTNKKIKFYSIDLLDKDTVVSVIEFIKPDIIFHLAGNNKGDLKSLFEANVICTKNLLDAILQANINPRILISGSSSQYGYVGPDPIEEKISFAPLSEYGISKCSQEYLAKYYCKKNGMQIIFTRTFNLIGPNQPSDLFIGSIINQLIEIKKGLRTDIQVVHLNSSRDYIDIRDVVNAYWMLVCSPDYLQKMVCEEFNVGSGKGTSLVDIINTIFECVGMNPQLTISQPEMVDLIPSQIASIRKISDNINWKPNYSIRDSIEYNLIESNIFNVYS